jgi:hypothetical protein
MPDSVTVADSTYVPQTPLFAIVVVLAIVPIVPVTASAAGLDALPANLLVPTNTAS